MPIEVKSETNTRSKSLEAFIDKHAPTNAIIVSMNDYERTSIISRVPLYLTDRLVDLIEPGESGPVKSGA